MLSVGGSWDDALVDAAPFKVTIHNRLVEAALIFPTIRRGDSLNSSGDSGQGEVGMEQGLRSAN